MAGIDPRFYWLTLGLLGLCTLVGLVVAYRLQREVNEDLAPPSERDLLGPLEKAYYSGLMREEEFQRIQESMARQKGEEAPTASKASKLRAKLPTVEAGSEAGPALGADVLPAITPPDDSGPGPAPG